jgi:NifU-like protein involved in Fe-S cluster formation
MFPVSERVPMVFQNRIEELKKLITSSPLRRIVSHETVRSTSVHPSCGDEVCFTAVFDNNMVITDIGVTGEGCLLSKAAGILAAQYALGKTIAEVSMLSDDLIIALLDLGPLGPTRRQCVSVVVDALKKLIKE